MSLPAPPPKRSSRLSRWELIGIGVLSLFVLGLSAILGFRSLPSGYTSTSKLNISTVIGEWQATQSPWRIAFRADKTMAMSPSGTLESGTMEQGTYRLWSEGDVLVKMQSGKGFTATFREFTPNQFDLVDWDSGAVTVFKKVQ